MAESPLFCYCLFCERPPMGSRNQARTGLFKPPGKPKPWPGPPYFVVYFPSGNPPSLSGTMAWCPWPTRTRRVATQTERPRPWHIAMVVGYGGGCFLRDEVGETIGCRGASDVAGCCVFRPARDPLPDPERAVVVFVCWRADFGRDEGEYARFDAALLAATDSASPRPHPGARSIDMAPGGAASPVGHLGRAVVLPGGRGKVMLPDGGYFIPRDPCHFFLSGGTDRKVERSAVVARS